MLKLVFGAAAGFAAAWFLDPNDGTRRRHVLRDKTLKYARRGKDEAVRKADYAAGHVKGAAHEATPSTAKPGLTDQDLARKVETVIFRDADVPKGQINVDAVGRKVTLRGEATPDMINRLVEQTAEIAEVQEVENLLHAPGTPAPTRADTPASQRKEGPSEGPSAPEPAAGVTAEQKTGTQAEPKPAEVAASGSGRQAAPVGSEDEGGKAAGKKSKK